MGKRLSYIVIRSSFADIILKGNMRKPISFVYRLGAVLFIFAIIYNEHILYTINSWTWKKLKCKDESNCLKILLVADPQLIGEKNEIYHSITPLSIWDSDRYLKKTYSLAVDHLSPDVIVFLGDLFDEGSIASSAQYIRYFKRLLSIFTTEYPIVHIWLPGDNDIGGENDQVTEAKVKRFEESFAQSSVIDVKNVRFSKVNRMIHGQQKSFDLAKEFNTDEQKISVAVSHMPLILVPSTIVDEVIEVLKPKIIFAAHEHKSKVVRTNIWQQYRKVDDIAHNNKIHEYKLEQDKIIELLIPTCSYRMGTLNIGYGAAIIENDEPMQYTVFWSPERFFYLKLYLVVPVLILIYALVEYICRKFFSPRIILMSKLHYPYRIIKNGV